MLGNRLHKVSRFSLYAGLSLSFFAVLFIIGSGPGHRFFNLELKTSLQLFALAGYQAVAAIFFLIAASLCLKIAGQRNLYKWTALGLIMSLPIATSAIRMKRVAGRVPRIHDITTDFSDPPQFVRLLPVREKCPNGARYGGAAVFEQQLQNYPHIFTVEIAEPMELIFEKSLKFAKEFGWEIVDSDISTGRIEATDTSFWFGFKDDVVIRLRKKDGGVKLDLRSASREGISDLGVNAKRIHKSFQKFIP